MPHVTPVSTEPFREPSRSSGTYRHVEPEREERRTPPAPNYLGALKVMAVGAALSASPVHAGTSPQWSPEGVRIARSVDTPTGIGLADMPLTRQIALMKQNLQTYAEAGDWMTPYDVVPSEGIVALVGRVLDEMESAGRVPDDLLVTADESFVINAGSLTVEVFFNGDIVFERRSPDAPPVMLDVDEEQLRAHLSR